MVRKVAKYFFVMHFWKQLIQFRFVLHILILIRNFYLSQTWKNFYAREIKQNVFILQGLLVATIFCFFNGEVE